MLLTGLLLVACSACFLIEPRSTSPGMALPTIGRTLPHQSQIKKMPNKLTYSPVLWEHFSAEAPSSLMTSLCQVDIKLASTEANPNFLSNAVASAIMKSKWGGNHAFGFLITVHEVKTVPWGRN